MSEPTFDETVRDNPQFLEWNMKGRIGDDCRSCGERTLWVNLFFEHAFCGPVCLERTLTMFGLQQRREDDE